MTAEQDVKTYLQEALSLSEQRDFSAWVQFFEKRATLLRLPLEKDTLRKGEMAVQAWREEIEKHFTTITDNFWLSPQPNLYETFKDINLEPFPDLEARRDRLRVLLGWVEKKRAILTDKTLDSETVALFRTYLTEKETIVQEQWETLRKNLPTPGRVRRKNITHTLAILKKEFPTFAGDGTAWELLAENILAPKNNPNSRTSEEPSLWSKIGWFRIMIVCVFLKHMFRSEDLSFYLLLLPLIVVFIFVIVILHFKRSR